MDAHKYNERKTCGDRELISVTDSCKSPKYFVYTENVEYAAEDDSEDRDRYQKRGNIL